MLVLVFNFFLKLIPKNGDPILGNRKCGNELIPIISCDRFIIGLIISCGT